MTSPLFQQGLSLATEPRRDTIDHETHDRALQNEPQSDITKDDIRVRMAAVDENVWPPPATVKPLLPDPSLRIP